MTNEVLGGVSRAGVAMDRWSMGTRGKAMWKYNHDRQKQPSSVADRVVLIALLCCCGFGIVTLASKSAFIPKPVAVAALFVGSIGVVVRQRRRANTTARYLVMAPRYLICGNQVIYFANVTRADLDSYHGQLRLVTGSGTTFTLERSRFPTGARKPEKIANNTQAKFGKVSQKLLETIRRCAPDAVISHRTG